MADATGWDLTAPAYPTQDLPHVCRGVAAAACYLESRREALQGPQRVGKAIDPGDFQPQVQRLLAWRVGHLAWRAPGPG